MNNSILNPKTSMLDLLYKQQNNPVNLQVSQQPQQQQQSQQNVDVNKPNYDEYGNYLGSSNEIAASGPSVGNFKSQYDQYGNYSGMMPAQNQQSPQQNQAQQMQSGQTPNLQNPYSIPAAGTYNYMIPQASTQGAQEVIEANKMRGEAEARQAQKSAPIYQDIEKANQEYQQNLKSTQEKGEKDISESIERQKKDAEDVANHQFLSKSDILNRMSGTDKVLSALGSIAGGISQGLLRSNSNPYWQQFDNLAESEIMKNNREYAKVKDKLDNDKSLTDTQRNLLMMRTQNLGQANVAQVNAFKSSLDSIAHDENLPVIVRANAKERTGQAQMILDQMHFENQMMQAQYARDLGPTSDRYVPGFGIAINKEAAEKLAPIVQNQRLFNQSLNTLFRNRDAAGHPVPMSQFSHEDQLEYQNMLKHAAALTGVSEKEIEDKIGNPSHFMVQDPKRAYQFLNEFVNRPAVQNIMQLNHGLSPQPMYSSQPQQVRQ